MSRAIEEQFSAEVADPRRHVVGELSAESDLLLILFGGIAGGAGMRLYEFFRITRGHRVKRLLLRDPFRTWNLRGLSGGGDAIAMHDALAKAIGEIGAKRVVMAGVSTGSFATMLRGAWLRADAVVAFSPQTFIGRFAGESMCDGRWADQFAVEHMLLKAEHPHYDALPHH